MNKINLKQFADDVKDGKLNCKGYEDGGYNLTNYIYNNQPNTELWHVVNQDVYIEFVPSEDWYYIEDYGNRIPNWTDKVIKDMLKVAKNALESVEV